MKNNIRTIGGQKPNFFIVGAARCGTTSLYHYLNSHPDIFMSPIKEPNYFCSDITNLMLKDKSVPKRNFNIKEYILGSMDEYYHRAFITDLTDYLGLFNNVSNEKMIGEASVNYLLSNVASKKIKKYIPHAKIIIILRNPIDQVISNYLARLRLGQITHSLNREISKSIKAQKSQTDETGSLLSQGLYFNQIGRYFTEFTKKKVKIIIYDDYKKNTQNTLIDILKFLNIDSETEINLQKSYNLSSGIRFQKFIYILSYLRIKQKLFYLIPNKFRHSIKGFFMKPNQFRINPTDQNDLINFFKADIVRTSELINRDLNHWIT